MGSEIARQGGKGVYIIYIPFFAWFEEFTEGKTRGFIPLCKAMVCDG